MKKPKFIKMHERESDISLALMLKKPLWENDYILVPVGQLENGSPYFEIERRALFLNVVGGDLIMRIIRDDFYAEDQQISREYYYVKF
jgi:hypothetical protein